MDKIKLVIADPDAAFADMAARFMKNFSNIQVVGCEQNGQDALRVIRSSHADAVLFDLVLPGMDGLSLLRNVAEIHNPPAMICCTRFYSDVAMEALRNLGAAYVMYKPVELQALHPAIVSCTELHQRMRRSKRSMEAGLDSSKHGSAHIRNYIISLGVPSKLVGCTYLTEAVRLARMDVTLVRNLSKGLYLEISRSMNTTPTRIERSIRNAITIAYQSGGLDGRLVSCPSNKEFINYVLRTIDL